MAQFPDSDKRSISSASDTGTLTEEEWQEMLSKLKKKLRRYEQAKKRGDEETIKRLVREIGQLMSSLADGHSDPEVRAEWTRKANNFEKAPEEAKEHMLLDIGKGLGIIVASPFLVAGGILYGVGLFAQGVGNLLTGGIIGRVAK
ncbi:hypothetical protein B0H17DRAFT_1084809 [Mycena rosella]|uniref:Uncharacterized protein n=1 Tax=Mycena rosella TaxID=1033263 RepID=A0AAD7CZM7_MYCRO|nr:hypothetical protein B0H17DRAFT_1084809 [Mycena rosella]